MAQHNGTRAVLARAAAGLLIVAAGCGDPPTLEEAMEGDTGGFVRAASIDRGRLLFARHGCVACHGVEGRGDGRFGAGLQPAPRDFHDAATFRFGADIESIAATIDSGVVVDGARVMPAFSHLSPADRRSLAAFIRSLAEADPAAGEPADSAAAGAAGS